jgi:uncharacterized DUF497 family protein
MTTREIEFDPDKAARNWRVHKVMFEDAALVFADPMRLERLDDSESNTDEEERWQTLGKVHNVLFVVYAERGNKTRIISARPASGQEKRSYYGNDYDNRKGWTKADEGTNQENPRGGEAAD